MKLCFMPSGLFNYWPLQFLRTGYYHRSYGYPTARTVNGIWWSSTAGSATYGRRLNTWTGNVHAQTNSFRGAGFALRCGNETPNLNTKSRFFKAPPLFRTGKTLTRC